MESLHATYPCLSVFIRGFLLFGCGHRLRWDTLRLQWTSCDRFIRRKVDPEATTPLRCYRNKHTGEYQVPKETCSREILYKLDAEAVETVVAQWMEGLDETELRCIAIDGKTLKGTAKRNDEGEKKDALHLVSAVNDHNARLLAQEAVKDKSNEIPAVHTLIERFPHLDGVTVTADAMHCLDETARLIVQKKGGPTTFA